jgi:acylphosphatase
LNAAVGAAYRPRPMPDTHHASVFFSGHVQRVGFRFAAMQVAKEFEVAGWVRNLADGRVQLEAEGAEREVGAFVDAVQERMHGHIRKVERTDAKRAPQFRGFTIN